jgi:hypothetical protein
VLPSAGFVDILGSKSSGSPEAAVDVIVGIEVERAVRGKMVGRRGIIIVNVLEGEIRCAVF